MREPKVERNAALDHIDARWDAQRTEHTLLVARQKLRHRALRARMLAYGGALSAAGAVVALAFTWNAQHGSAPTAQNNAPVPSAAQPATASTPSSAQPATASTPSSAQPATASAPSSAQPATASAHVQPMQLVDGSEIAPLDADARVMVTEVSPARMSVELTTGRAHFEIAHRPERVFRVTCGAVVVEVLGTSFDLERDGPRTRVSVLRGRVAVQWSDGRAELAAGEAGWFPKAPAAATTAATADAKPTTPKPATPAAQAATQNAAWREPAERGDFTRAYVLLAQAKHAANDDVEELMLAADTARISGHPDAALPFLNRVVTRHAKDARAPLAAFTLGGLLMQQLDRPRDAEAAYARARELSPDSSLAQDALARQVEAAHRAGDAARAAALAKEYLTAYPNGRRVHAVRDFGGVVSE